MNPERHLQKNIESWFQITEIEEGIIEVLKQESPSESDTFKNFLDNSERALDEIQDPRGGEMARHYFSVKVAIMYALAGFTEYAYELLHDLEKFADETDNSRLLDVVVDTQNILDSIQTTPPSPTSPLQ